MDGVNFLDTAKISVIVPVYKVEPYLRKCLDSIVGQSYENREILLVDDGSPDSCGAICDEYAQKDPRVQVIHKENGGLSSARNAGLDAAGGHWIAFIDSDDWVEPDFLEYLLLGAKGYGADLAVCAYWWEYPDRSEKLGYDRPTRLTARQALEALLRDKQLTNHAWNKLYRRELFEGVRFPEGRVYEDVATVYRLVERAMTVAVLPEAKLHYRMNPAGIVKANGIENFLDYWAVSKERCDALLPRYPEYAALLRLAPMSAAIEVWSRVWPIRRKLTAEQKAALEEIAAFVRQYGPEALAGDAFGPTGKLRIRAIAHPGSLSYWFARQMRRLYEKKHG